MPRWFLKGQLLAPIVFDRQAGLYWQGSRNPPSAGDRNAVILKEVYALQILEKWVKQTGPDTGGYTSYELNLVTRLPQANQSLNRRVQPAFTRCERSAVV